MSVYGSDFCQADLRFPLLESRGKGAGVNYVSTFASLFPGNQTQPFVYPFGGGDVSGANLRTPRFRNVMRHFVRAENEDFIWPEEGTRMMYSRFPKRGGDDLGKVSASRHPSPQPLRMGKFAPRPLRGRDDTQIGRRFTGPDRHRGNGVIVAVPQW